MSVTRSVPGSKVAPSPCDEWPDGMAFTLKSPALSGRIEESEAILFDMIPVLGLGPLRLERSRSQLRAIHEAPASAYRE